MLVSSQYEMLKQKTKDKTCSWNDGPAEYGADQNEECVCFIALLPSLQHLGGHFQKHKKVDLQYEISV